MNILFVTDLYPVQENEKNTPRTLFSFVNEWQNMGHNVSVLKPNFLFNSFLRKKPFYKTGQYNDIFNVNYVTPFLGNVQNRLPKYEYDVIVAHMPSGIIFANKLKGKLVCAVHNSDLEVLINPLYKFYFKSKMENAYERAVGIACRSQVLKEKFLKLYPQYERKTFLCESGVDFEPILRLDNKRKKIVTCANLKKRKNVDKLVEAVNDLPQFDLTVIGDGEMLSCLTKKAHYNVHLVGRKNHDEVIEIMKNSDIFVLPSVNETFGMVYLEAMASGCITVCTRKDGIDGIINDGKNGFLVEPTVNSIKDVLQKIEKLPQIDVESILQDCYNTVKTYNSHSCASRYLQNLLKII